MAVNALLSRRGALGNKPISDQTKTAINCVVLFLFQLIPPSVLKKILLPFLL